MATAKAKKATAKATTMTAMDHVKLARDPKRPHIFDFISTVCSDFEELHGDRLVNDDRGLVCGFGAIDDYKCLIVWLIPCFVEIYEALGLEGLELFFTTDESPLFIRRSRKVVRETFLE